ncbi:hypothetical protein SAMN05892883_4201 [Jatrophihabitans sp. GAS493]|nr:hypothetical protein SAMN05892883_4201 [Jatrophihabitans sp. GAS493]
MAVRYAAGTRQANWIKQPRSLSPSRPRRRPRCLASDERINSLVMASDGRLRTRSCD